METLVILDFCLLVLGRAGNENWLTVTSSEETCWKNTGQPPQWLESLQNWGARTKARTADRPQPQNWTVRSPWLLPLTLDTTDHRVTARTLTPLTVFFLLPLAFRRDFFTSLLFSICSCCFKVLGGTVWADGPWPYPITYLQGRLGRQTYPHFQALPPNKMLMVEGIPQTRKRISSAGSPKYKCLWHCHFKPFLVITTTKKIISLMF